VLALCKTPHLTTIQKTDKIIYICLYYRLLQRKAGKRSSKIQWKYLHWRAVTETLTRQPSLWLNSTSFFSSMLLRIYLVAYSTSIYNIKRPQNRPRGIFSPLIYASAKRLYKMKEWAVWITENVLLSVLKAYHKPQLAIESIHQAPLPTHCFLRTW
jgi:hypothetical protein